MSMKLSINTLWALIIALCVWAYLPAMSGGFLFDDRMNIADNELLKIDSFSIADIKQASFSSHSGPLRRPVAMFSFAVNHLLSGMSPLWMKITNLLIHLLNGCLVFFILARVLQHADYVSEISTRALALFVSAFWLLHPINVTAVAYIVQRMTSLSATFVLLAICGYIKIRECHSYRPGTYLLFLLTLLCCILGLLTKEVAVLLSLYIFLIEWLVFKFQTHSQPEFRSLLVFWSILAMPWAGALAYVLYRPSFILDAYEVRDFGPLQRLMTEFRIVLDYVSNIVLPDSRYMGVYQDGIQISQNLVTPVTTLISFCLLAALVIWALLARKTKPLVCLGVLWFFAGHIPESTIYALELKFLHRNYLPSIGLILALTLVITSALKNYRYYLYAMAAVVIAGCTFSTRSLSHTWSYDTRMQLIEALNSPGSPRANYRAGQLLKAYAIVTEPGEKRDEYRDLAIHHFSQIDKLPFGDKSGKMGMVQTYVQTGTRPPEDLVESLIRDLETCEFNVGMTNIFETYTDCFAGGTCLLDEDSYIRMVEAVYRNENAYGYFKRAVLASYARFLADYREDYKAAIIVLHKALNVYSVIHDLRDIALHYEKLNMIKEANETLELLEENDHFGVHRAFIQEMRFRITTPPATG